ncbi:hypothetical protein [Pararhodobacter zhoushanensis]|uniref:hypothetical protein n=1 Tax=Pararhodobacter zhoushanensis TaxID=2479545 RepID=UPI000F8F56C9|nr:hypothetical protein [Pararhodobacter zhoushanensis]
MPHFLPTRAPRLVAQSLILALTATTAFGGTMADVSALCFDRSRDGLGIRATLEQEGWHQAVVDRDGRYTDLATALVLEITDEGADLDERFARAPQLAGNFEQMVLSGAARVYEKDAALLFVAMRPLLEGGEQVTCILGMPRDPETDALMEQHGGAQDDADTGQLSRRVIEDDDAGTRSMRLWSRLTHEPSPTPLTDLFYMERLTPQG